jgi:hypothetical protein
MANWNDILLKCLELEWQDHFQTRAQTWKTLEIEGALAVALVGVNWVIKDPHVNLVVTLVGSILLISAAWLGAQITYNHSKVQVLKFKHIIDIETRLGLTGPDAVFHDVALPKAIRWYDPLLFWRGSTPLFILRMHLILIIIGLVFLGLSIVRFGAPAVP